MPVINSTATAMSQGTTPVTGTGQDSTFTFSGSFNTGDKYTVLLTDVLTGVQTQIGAGFVTGVVPVYSYTYQNKVYILSGATTYFSSLGSATTWNDPNATGNGFVSMSDWYSTPEDLVALSSFQGRVAFFSRSTVQLWNVAANPAQWSQAQVLDNIGTLAGGSVKNVGDLEVFFLADNGVRSLRALATTLNAYVDDPGSAIDTVVLAQLATLTDDQIATSQSIVEPKFKRYWLSIPNSTGTGSTIYVYSGFRSSKVSAWSTYQTTYQNGNNQTAFTPQNFVILGGYVYTRDSDALYGFGIPVANGGALYDNCVATIISPYSDMKKPINIKQSLKLDIVGFGDFTTAPTNPCTWAVSVGLDPISGIFEQVINQGSATASHNVNPTNPAIQTTTDSEGFPYSAQGTHFAFKAVTSGVGAAKLSEIIYSYNDNGEKQ